jgi:hypothetical protein
MLERDDTEVIAGLAIRAHRLAPNVGRVELAAGAQLRHSPGAHLALGQFVVALAVTML